MMIVMMMCFWNDKQIVASIVIAVVFMKVMTSCIAHLVDVYALTLTDS